MSKIFDSVSFDTDTQELGMGMSRMYGLAHIRKEFRNGSQDRYGIFLCRDTHTGDVWVSPAFHTTRLPFVEATESEALEEIEELAYDHGFA